LIGIGDPAVQVAELVEGHLLEVGLVEVLGESAFEVDGEAFVEEVEEGVDEGGGDGDEAEVEDPLDEDCLVALYDRFHDLSVEAGYVDAQEGPQHQEHREQAQVQHFLALPGGDDYLDECFDAFEEDGVDVAFSAFLRRAGLTFLSLRFSGSLMESVADFLFLA
jgi:hypothetical protein